MYTIMDYLKYYKDTTFKEASWNMMDNLLCSILAYMKIKSFKGIKTFKQVSNLNLKLPVGSSKDLMSNACKEIFEIIKDSKRYKDLLFKDFINRVDGNTQFGAVTIISKEAKIISFKGTDRSMIGWIENFRLIYDYPTYTQSLAIEYLKNNILLFDSNVYVVGHSKGGNLAMASAMELDNLRLKKVKSIVNFDGPGFRKQEYESDKFKRMHEKLINIMPSGSYVGALMYNDDFKVIATNAKALNVHYPINWNSYGSVFIPGKYAKMSEEIHKRTTDNMNPLDYEQVKKILEDAFETLDYKSGKNLSFSFKNMKDLLKIIRADSKSSKYVITVLQAMFKLSNKK